MPPYPQTSKGYIDDKEVFKLIIGTLSLPLSYMDELTFEELGWLVENHLENEKQQYEILAHVVSVGYARTQTKKKIKLFQEEKRNKSRIQNITQSEKQQKLSKLDEIFQRREAL